MSANSSQSKAESREVPVLDMHLKRDRRVGNPYRTANKKTGEWGSEFATKEQWITHPNPHVLPANGDYDVEKIVPVTEYEGHVQPTPDVLKPDKPNVFECPRCKTELEGYPEYCEQCNAKFTW